MSPLTSRQIFIWSLPTLFLLSFLWYKRKKGALQSDPGGTPAKQSNSSDTNIEHPTDTAQEKPVVTEEVEDNLQISIESDKLQSVYNISEEISSSLGRRLNPEASDFVICARGGEPENVKESKILDFIKTVSTELSYDLKSVSRKSKEEIIIEKVGNSVSKGSCASTSSKAEEALTFPRVEQAIPPSEEVQVSKRGTVNSLTEDIQVPVIEDFGVSNQSWAAECELELSVSKVDIVPSEKKESTHEMARELSSDATLEGNAIEEDCIVRNLHVETLTLESKLSSLELDGTEEKTADNHLVSVVKEGNGNERDSANHSPAEVMLGSPSMSNYSDVQSEGSSDSGKGCSDVATPPSRTPASGSSVAGDPPVPSVYEFVLPQLLVGRLIGCHGTFVHQIKTKTHANILIKRHPETAKLKICAIEGTQMDIESALEMIRQKFPIKRYPNVTLEQVSFLSPSTNYPLMPESFQLQLIEGVNNDVILSSLVSPAHFFLQQPTHPTYPALNRLNLCMNYCYSEPSAPALPTPIESSVICVAPTMGGWYRAQIVASNPATETCDVRFIDYGGYLTIENSLLRQIRSDFITLPFQAAECYLANVKPKDGVWAYEAMAFVEELTHGCVIQAQIYGYAKDGIPAVYLFSIQGSQVIVINRELVLRGYAEWDEPTEEPESSATSETFAAITSEAFTPVTSEAYTPVASEA